MEERVYIGRERIYVAVNRESEREIMKVRVKEVFGYKNSSTWNR